MSENQNKTLNDIDREALTLRNRFKSPLAVGASQDKLNQIAYAKEQIGKLGTLPEKTAGDTTEKQRLHAQFTDIIDKAGKSLVGHTTEYEAAAAEPLKAAKQHFDDHAAEYHELAVIGAHQDGVKITVEQPYEVGEQVPVRHVA